MNWNKIIIIVIIIIQAITIYDLIIINKDFSSRFESINSYLIRINESFSSRFESINSHLSIIYERANMALLCGNGVCDQGETYQSCTLDCGPNNYETINCTKDEDCGVDVCIEKHYGHMRIQYLCWAERGMGCVESSTLVECCDSRDCPNGNYCLNFDCTNYCEPRGCCKCVNNELVPDDEYCKSYEGYKFNYCREDCQCGV